MASKQILVLINFALCTGIGWSCLCRLNLMHKDVRRGVRAQFVAIFLGASASGFQQILFGDRPGVGDLVMNGAVLLMLVISSGRWRHGPPDDAQTNRSTSP